MVIAQYTERSLPYDFAAEMAVLGALLIDGEALHQVSDIIKPADFHRAINRFCYDACLALSERGDVIDQITVARELQRRDRLEQVGGMPYLGQLIAETPTSANISHYAAIVADTAAKRRIIDAGNRIAEIGFEDAGDAHEIMRRAVDTLFGAAPPDSAGGFIHIGEPLDGYLHGEDGIGAIGARAHQTCFPTLDDITGGFGDEDLVILGARPSIGKTAMALNILTALVKPRATRHDLVGAIFSMEMSLSEVAGRILCAESGIPAGRVKLGLLSESEEAAMVDTVGMLSGLPIYIDPTPFQTIAEMRSKAKRLKMERGLDFLAVDYLQLVQVNGSGHGNRAQEIAEISRGLKRMAKDLEIPVLACSQLNRAVENRPNRRPQLSDLRDSGSIEQDADMVIFLHRPDKSYSEEEWYQAYPGQPYPAGLVDVICAKNRNGPTGETKLFFRDELRRFQELPRYEAKAA